MGPFQLIVLILIPFTEAKVKKSGYYPVSACPKDANEWEAASRRLMCNNTHSYHCAPYHDRSQLYEFCYEMVVLKVKKGHCLGVAESGILNFDSCHFFSQGCPNEDYQSNEMYKYPSCLSIQENCYTEDCVCNCFTAASRSIYRKDVNRHAEQNQSYLIPFVICCIISVLSIILNVLQFIRGKVLKKGNVPVGEDQRLLQNTERRDIQNARSQYQPENDKHQIYEKTLVSYTIDNSEIFLMLKRQCLFGNLAVFKHLVGSRVKPKAKYYIFQQCDENGCILLHFAAQGGSTLIVDEIFENVSNDILELKSIRGETALHFAIRYQQTDMVQYLIKAHSKRFSRLREIQTSEVERQGTSKYATLANDTGELSPVHWAAWYGDERLLHSLEQANFDISTKTRNGLNILHIACMSDEFEGNITFCKHLLEHKSDKIPPKETDLSGWNIAHYASMSNKNLLEFIAKNRNKDLQCLILEKTDSGKTCLHIACEFGKLEIVKIITKKFGQLVTCKDELGRNALHFAAKGGNLEILKYLSNEGLDLKSLTSDGRTILHIACIYKNVNICQYAVEQFSEDFLNVETKERSLTAAHYLGSESKGDRSEIDILEIFCNSAMDLKIISKFGQSVLDRAIDQLNTDLIQAMVSKKFRGKCGIDKVVLSKQLANAKNEAIKNVLKMALNDIKE